MMRWYSRIYERQNPTKISLLFFFFLLFFLFFTGRDYDVTERHFSLQGVHATNVAFLQRQFRRNYTSFLGLLNRRKQNLLAFGP
jgi:hypothetical protein